MARYLHLLKADAPALAPEVIGHPAPDATVTVVMLDGSVPPPLPPGARLLRLGEGLDHAGLLDLIFEADHVISW
jgi:hypothetical protein